MGPVEEIGLLKMDFLGLRNLDVIEDAVEIVKRSRGIELDVENAAARRREDLRDARAPATRSASSSSSRRACATPSGRSSRPSSATSSRSSRSTGPGAMRYIADYARGKRDPSSVRYQDERLRPITEATYGCCIYQEQLMEISKQIAGFTPPEADDLRKAIGKKKRDMMATMEAEFLEGPRVGDRPGRLPRTSGT